MSLLLIEKGCPNCGGVISDDRLLKGLPCKRCLPEVMDGDLCGLLEKRGSIQRLREVCGAERKLKEFEVFFEKALGSKPWSLQKLWAKRVFLKESFAVVAPTGVGKTTFGLVMSLFLEPKSLLLFPTKILASQAGEKLRELAKKAGLEKKVLVYESKKRVKDAFLEGNFDILCGTNMFLHKNFENLRRFKFSFIFVDDIDSFLKSSRNVDNLFRLLGFGDEEIKLALKERKGDEDWEKLSRIRQKKKDTVLLISSATLKPKGNRVFLFRNLLGFEVQRAVVSVRNIVDVAHRVGDLEEALERSVDLIRKLGGGGLVYLSAVYGKEKVQEVTEFYRSRGVRAVSYLEHRPEDLINLLERGEFEVAVGISHIGNPLVRGIDLPHVIRYAVFLDTPKHLFPTDLSLQPSLLHSLILTLLNVFEDRDRIRAMEYAGYLRKYLTMKEDKIDRYPKLKEKLQEIKDFIEKFLRDRSFLKKVQEAEDVSLVEKDGRMFIVVGDANSYIQASGRTSRFVAGGMTRGLSVVFYADAKAFRSLKRRISAYFPQADVEFRDLEDVDLERLLKEIDEDRRRAREVLEGKAVQRIKDLFRTTLVVVESPNKAKTIAGFFGKPQMRLVRDTIAYEVPLGERLLIITASLGHVLDVVTDKGFFGVLEEDSGFTPVYDTIKRCKENGVQHTEEEYLKERCRGRIEDKMTILEGLRDLSYQVDEVFIATDPDAEGEKIAYDLLLFLKPFNRNIKRAEFHEVTPRAFREAVERPRDFDVNLVKAQLVRRVLDRWVGFTLSRILWKVFGKNYFSAGRVQTPVLGWVIERYRKSREKKGEIEVKVGGQTFRIEVEDLRIAESVYEDLDLARIYLAGEREEEKVPPPPHTTDTVLQEAGDRLRLSAQRTMRILQNLFEAGLITYHRTDSTRVSETGRFSVAKPYISERFGEEIFHPRSWGEGGAHECIRPTRPLDPKDLRVMVTGGLVDLEDPQNSVRVYDLIFRRFMASQMKPAKVRVADLKIELPYFEWSTVVVLDILEEGYNLLLKHIKTFSRKERYDIEDKSFRKVPKVSLFTQGSLIQEMKRRGLGRPSTYAHIVQTLIDRGYVIERGGRLIPTKKGIQVYEHLTKNYPEYTSEDLTRKLEEDMDRVERGEADYMEILREVHRVKELLKEVGEVPLPGEVIYE
ncbi:MAG: reverse gyrase [Aquificota bacterium]|nr:reverse gyrase [Aquificota bacterium]